MTVSPSNTQDGLSGQSMAADAESRQPNGNGSVYFQVPLKACNA